MTFNMYLSNLGSIVSIAFFVGLILGRKRNHYIFEALTPFRATAALPSFTIGEGSAAFLEHTIFFLFRNSPTSHRTVLLSTLLSLSVLAITLAYCQAFGLSSFHFDQIMNLSFGTEQSAFTSFEQPWLFNDVKDAFWPALALIILLIADYLSFLQTYLLMRMAKNTLSILEILFVCWVNLAVTFFTSIFVVSAIIMVIILKIMTMDIQYTTIVRPSVDLTNPSNQARFAHVFSDIFPESLGHYGGSMIPVTISTAIIAPNGGYSDAELQLLVTAYTDPKLGGILLKSRFVRRAR